MDLTIDDVNNFQPGNFDWEIQYFHDLRSKEDTEKIKNFTQKEVEIAKNIVIKRIEEDGNSKYNPDMYLMDMKNIDIIIIYVIHNEKYQYDGNKSRDRTYSIKDRKIIREEKGKNKGYGIILK